MMSGVGVAKPSRAGSHARAWMIWAKCWSVSRVLCQLNWYWRTVSSIRLALNMPASPHRASWWLMRPRVQRNWGSKAVWLSCSIRAWLMQSFRLPLASQKGMLGLCGFWVRLISQIISIRLLPPSMPTRMSMKFRLLCCISWYVPSSPMMNHAAQATRRAKRRRC